MMQFSPHGQAKPVSQLPLGWFVGSDNRLYYNGSRGIIAVEDAKEAVLPAGMTGTPVIVSF